MDRIGKDKVAALLLSVDESYGSHGDAVQGMSGTLKELNLRIPCAIAPGGFTETKRLFGIDGYSIFLVGPDGVVKGTDLQAEELERLIAG